VAVGRRILVVSPMPVGDTSKVTAAPLGAQVKSVVVVRQEETAGLQGIRSAVCRPAATDAEAFDIRGGLHRLARWHVGECVDRCYTPMVARTHRCWGADADAGSRCCQAWGEDAGPAWGRSGATRRLRIRVPARRDSAMVDRWRRRGAHSVYDAVHRRIFRFSARVGSLFWARIPRYF